MILFEVARHATTKIEADLNGSLSRKVPLHYPCLKHSSVCSSQGNPTQMLPDDRIAAQD